jgi:hypothetical protein
MYTASSRKDPVPDTVLLSSVSKMVALPTANNREFPAPVRSSVAPFPWMVMLAKMIGVAVSPNGLCASRSQEVLKEYAAFCSTIVNGALTPCNMHPVL